MELWAFIFDLANVGNNIAAKMAMMAMTTNNSIRVNASVALSVRLEARLSLDISSAYQTY